MGLLKWQNYVILHAKDTNMAKANIRDFLTFSPEDILALPSASLAERAPMPVDGKTADNINRQYTLCSHQTKGCTKDK